MAVLLLVPSAPLTPFPVDRVRLARPWATRLRCRLRGFGLPPAPTYLLRWIADKPLVRVRGVLRVEATNDSDRTVVFRHRDLFRPLPLLPVDLRDLSTRRLTVFLGPA